MVWIVTHMVTTPKFKLAVQISLLFLQKAVGVAERYEILLLNDNGILLSNTSEPATTKQHKFEDLTPGKKYKIQILTVSGGLLSKEAQTEGRTGNVYSLLSRPRSLPGCCSFRVAGSEGWGHTGRWYLFLDTMGTFTVNYHFPINQPHHAGFTYPTPS